MAKTRTKLIGTATTLTLTSILLWIAFNQNFILTASGDITCAGLPFHSDLFKKDISDCQVFWNVTSRNFTYYFRNKNGVELGFSPEVDGFDMYVKDGRYKSGWRPLDKSGNFTYRKGIKYQFMAFIFKDIEQTVKWKITAADATIDPILFGINISTIQDCKTTTETEIKNNYRYYSYTLNQTKCSDEPINKTCKKVYQSNSTISEVIGNYADYINTTICKEIGIKIGIKEIYYKKHSMKCGRNGLIVSCDSTKDGNGDGVCSSGESCPMQFDIRDLKINSRLDSPSIKEGRFE